MTVATVKLSHHFDERTKEYLTTQLIKAGRRISPDGIQHDTFLCSPGHYTGTQLAQMNRNKITPLLYDPSGMIRPKMLGYKWTAVGKSEPWSHVYRPLVEDAKDYWKVKDIADHQMPMPTKTNKWRPTCYVKVEHLTRLPLWLLLDPFKVSFGGFRAKDHLTNKEMDQGKTSLTGPEIIERIPWEQSIMLSVAGWPLWAVPIKYLLWFASYGTLARELEIGHDSLLLHYEEEWGAEYCPINPVTGSKGVEEWYLLADGTYHYKTDACRFLTILERHIGQEQKAADLLRPKVIEYLNSAEGKSRLKEIDFSDYLPNEDVEDYDFGGNGAWTGKNVETISVPEASVEFRETWTLADYYGSPNYNNFGPWGSGLTLTNGWRRIKDYFFPEEALEIKNQQAQTISIETFSCSDQDRFGPWGSCPTAQFLSNGKPRFLSQRIVASALQGDIDPTPREFRLGSRGERQEFQSTWISPVYEEEFNWIPPALPTTYGAAYRQAHQILNELESLKSKWIKLHHPYYKPTNYQEIYDEQEQDLIDMTSKESILSNHCLAYLEGSPLWDEIDIIYNEVMSMLKSNLIFTTRDDVSDTFFVPEGEDSDDKEGEWFDIFHEEEPDDEEEWDSSWNDDTEYEDEYGYSEEDQEMEEVFA